MLGLFGKNKTRLIGLDIGHSSIKMIQMSRGSQTVRVEAAQERCLEPGLEQGSEQRKAFIVDSISKMLREGKFSGRGVISCVPCDMLKIKSLRMDTAEPEEIEKLMRTEVADRFGLDPASDEIRYIVAGNVYQGESIKNEIIFFGTAHKDLVEHLEMIEAAGLEPASIDTAPCALFRSFQMSLRRKEDKEIVSVLADLGSRFTTVIIGRGQQIVFIKQIPLAGEQLTQDVAMRLGIGVPEAALLRSKLRYPEDGTIDPETRSAVIEAMKPTIESLAREISLCFKYYAVTFRGQRPNEAVFAGGEAYEDTLMDALRNQLNVQIRIAEPLRGFDLSGGHFERRRNPQLCEWAVVVGLGLKGWELPEVSQTLQDEDVKETVAVEETVTV